MTPNNRTARDKMSNCPFCSGYRVNKTNSLSSISPKIASEWHPAKNGELAPSNIYYSSSKKVWWICRCGHEWSTSPQKRTVRKQGCSTCRNKKVLKGYNDMWTTNPELAYMLANPDDGYKYTQNSNKRVDWRSRCCGGELKDKRISDVNSHGLNCPRCSSNFSFGERFVYSLLSQTLIDFKKEITFDWSLGKRYDFYIPSYKMIIEVHGIQHYNGRFQTMGGRGLQEEQENDALKEKLAKENGIEHYIVIDALDSKVESIIKSTIESKLLDILEYDSDILENIEYFENNFMYLKAWELWNGGLKSVNKIAEILKVARETARAYLKRGAELNKCDYDVDQSRAYSLDRRTKKSSIKVVKMNLEGEYMETYNSIAEAARKNGMSTCSGVSACCNNRRKTSGGFKWKHKNEKVDVKIG
jgi:hypothetical protein